MEQQLRSAPARRLLGAPERWDEPAFQAYKILHFGFIVAPLVAGLDKFVNLLTQWEQYLSPVAIRLLPTTAPGFMKFVGVVEIAAAILVAVKPRIGAYVVAAWLGAIIINLLTIPGFYDIALRDFGLMLGALALARLAAAYDRDYDAP